jgi:signal transduction histidine kinase
MGKWENKRNKSLRSRIDRAEIMITMEHRAVPHFNVRGNSPDEFRTEWWSMASTAENGEWELEPVDIKIDVLLPVIERFKDSANSDEKEIGFTGGFGMIPILYLDKSRIRDVFAHLLRNAMNYSDPGTKISIIVHAHNGWVITFACYGAPMPDDICDCILGRGSETEKSTARDLASVANELVQCKNILSEMGSWIKIVQNGDPVAISFWLPRILSQDDWS